MHDARVNLRARWLVACAALVAVLAACSSDETKSSVDAGQTSSATEGGRSLPSCVGEGGYQCQPKGCLSGFKEIAGYDCGNSGGSCCYKANASDASAPADAASDG